MKADKVAQFIELAGQSASATFVTGSEDQRKLGAQLLLSEVLEYVVHGLGVVPSFNGTPITEPNELKYSITSEASKLDMIDGLADTAYTMYWNAVTFGVPLEKGFDLVCDNNLEKFVKLGDWTRGECELESSEWNLGIGVTWPNEVTRVQVVRSQGGFFAVGKDKSGKVRKPSSYKQVELETLL